MSSAIDGVSSDASGVVQEISDKTMVENDNLHCSKENPLPVNEKIETEFEMNIPKSTTIDRIMPNSIMESEISIKQEQEDKDGLVVDPKKIDENGPQRCDDNDEVIELRSSYGNDTPTLGSDLTITEIDDDKNLIIDKEPRLEVSIVKLNGDIEETIKNSTIQSSHLNGVIINGKKCTNGSNDFTITKSILKIDNNHIDELDDNKSIMEQQKQLLKNKEIPAMKWGIMNKKHTTSSRQKKLPLLAPKPSTSPQLIQTTTTTTTTGTIATPQAPPPPDMYLQLLRLPPYVPEKPTLGSTQLQSKSDDIKSRNQHQSIITVQQRPTALVNPFPAQKVIKESGTGLITLYKGSQTEVADSTSIAMMNGPTTNTDWKSDFEKSQRSIITKVNNNRQLHQRWTQTTLDFQRVKTTNTTSSASIVTTSTTVSAMQTVVTGANQQQIVVQEQQQQINNKSLLATNVGTTMLTSVLSRLQSGSTVSLNTNISGGFGQNKSEQDDATLLQHFLGAQTLASLGDQTGTSVLLRSLDQQNIVPSIPAEMSVIDMLKRLGTVVELEEQKDGSSCSSSTSDLVPIAPVNISDQEQSVSVPNALALLENIRIEKPQSPVIKALEESPLSSPASPVSVSSHQQSNIKHSVQPNNNNTTFYLGKDISVFPHINSNTTSHIPVTPAPIQPKRLSLSAKYSTPTQPRLPPDVSVFATTRNGNNIENKTIQQLSLSSLVQQVKNSMIPQQLNHPILNEINQLKFTQKPKQSNNRGTQIVKQFKKQQISVLKSKQPIPIVQQLPSEQPIVQIDKVVLPKIDNKINQSVEVRDQQTQVSPPVQSKNSQKRKNSRTEILHPLEPEIDIVEGHAILSSDGMFVFNMDSFLNVDLPTKDMIYSCDICSAVYQHAHRLKKHYLRLHISRKYIAEKDMDTFNIDPKVECSYEDPNNDQDAISNINDDTKLIFRCHTCRKCVASKAELKSHLTDHPPVVNLNKQVLKGVKNYRCDYCGVFFKWKKMFLKHKKNCRLQPSTQVVTPSTSGVTISKAGSSDVTVTTKATPLILLAPTSSLTSNITIPTTTIITSAVTILAPVTASLATTTTTTAVTTASVSSVISLATTLVTIASPQLSPIVTVATTPTTPVLVQANTTPVVSTKTEQTDIEPPVEQKLTPVPIKRSGKPILPKKVSSTPLAKSVLLPKTKSRNKKLRNNTVSNKNNNKITTRTTQSSNVGTTTNQSQSSNNTPPTVTRKRKQKLTYIRLLHHCLYCNETFHNGNKKRNHTLSNHPYVRKIHPCVFCQLEFVSNFDLFSHLVEQHSTVYFACTTCKDRFTNLEELANHNNRKHKLDDEEKLAFSKRISTIKQDQDCYTCTKCLRMFVIVSCFKSHTCTSIDQVDNNKTEKNNTLSSTSPTSSNLSEKKIIPATNTSGNSIVQKTNVNNPEKKDKPGKIKIRTKKSKVNEREAKTDNKMKPLDPEIAFFSQVSQNVRENLQNHLDGRLVQSGDDSSDENGNSSSNNRRSGHDGNKSTNRNADKNGRTRTLKSANKYSQNTSNIGANGTTVQKRTGNNSQTGCSSFQNDIGANSSNQQEFNKPRASQWEKYSFPKEYDGRCGFTSYIKDISCLDISTQLIMRKNMEELGEVQDFEKINNDELNLNEPNEDVPSVLALERMATRCAESFYNDDSTLTGGDDPLNNDGITTAIGELSGEWVRERTYICQVCAWETNCLWSMEDHKYEVHPSVLCPRLELVGDQRKLSKIIYTRLANVPAPFRSPPSEKLSILPQEIVCTKCQMKGFPTAHELHVHLLECAGEKVPEWLRCGIAVGSNRGQTPRKKRWSKKRRRPRRGLKRNIPNSPHKPLKLRSKPGDTETIQKMIANLPAKRLTRRVIAFDEKDLKTRSQAIVQNVQCQQQSVKSGSNKKPNGPKPKSSNNVNQSQRSSVNINEETSNTGLLVNSNHLRHSLLPCTSSSSCSITSLQSSSIRQTDNIDTSAEGGDVLSSLRMMPVSTPRQELLCTQQILDSVLGVSARIKEEELALSSGIKCTGCGQAFESKSVLRRHHKSCAYFRECGPTSQHQCKTCQKTFDNLVALIEHTCDETPPRLEVENGIILANEPVSTTLTPVKTDSDIPVLSPVQADKSDLKNIGEQSKVIDKTLIDSISGLISIQSPILIDEIDNANKSKITKISTNQNRTMLTTSTPFASSTPNHQINKKKAIINDIINNKPGRPKRKSGEDAAVAVFNTITSGRRGTYRKKKKGTSLNILKTTNVPATKINNSQENETPLTKSSKVQNLTPKKSNKGRAVNRSTGKVPSPKVKKSISLTTNSVEEVNVEKIENEPEVKVECNTELVQDNVEESVAKKRRANTSIEQKTKQSKANNKTRSLSPSLLADRNYILVDGVVKRKPGRPFGSFTRKSSTGIKRRTQKRRNTRINESAITSDVITPNVTTLPEVKTEKDDIVVLEKNKDKGETPELEQPEKKKRSRNKKRTYRESVSDTTTIIVQAEVHPEPSPRKIKKEYPVVDEDSDETVQPKNNLGRKKRIIDENSSQSKKYKKVKIEADVVSSPDEISVIEVEEIDINDSGNLKTEPNGEITNKIVDNLDSNNDKGIEKCGEIITSNNGIQEIKVEQEDDINEDNSVMKNKNEREQKSDKDKSNKKLKKKNKKKKKVCATVTSPLQPLKKIKKLSKEDRLKRNIKAAALSIVKLKKKKKILQSKNDTNGNKKKEVVKIAGFSWEVSDLAKSPEKPINTGENINEKPIGVTASEMDDIVEGVKVQRTICSCSNSNKIQSATSTCSTITSASKLQVSKSLDSTPETFQYTLTKEDWVSQTTSPLATTSVQPVNPVPSVNQLPSDNISKTLCNLEPVQLNQQQTMNNITSIVKSIDTNQTVNDSLKTSKLEQSTLMSALSLCIKQEEESENTTIVQSSNQILQEVCESQSQSSEHPDCFTTNQSTNSTLIDNENNAEVLKSKEVLPQLESLPKCDEQTPIIKITTNSLIMETQLPFSSPSSSSIDEQHSNIIEQKIVNSLQLQTSEETELQQTSQYQVLKPILVKEQGQLSPLTNTTKHLTELTSTSKKDGIIEDQHSISASCSSTKVQECELQSSLMLIKQELPLAVTTSTSVQALGTSLGTIIDSVNKLLNEPELSATGYSPLSHYSYSLSDIHNYCTDDDLSVLQHLGGARAISIHDDLIDKKHDPNIRLQTPTENCSETDFWPPNSNDNKSLMDLDNQQPQDQNHVTQMDELPSSSSNSDSFGILNENIQQIMIPNARDDINFLHTTRKEKSPACYSPTSKLMEPYQGKEVVCPTCNSLFLGFSALQAHVAKEHNTNQQPSQSSSQNTTMAQPGQVTSSSNRRGGLGTSKGTRVCHVCQRILPAHLMMSHLSKEHDLDNLSNTGDPDQDPASGERLKSKMSTALFDLLDKAVNNLLLAKPKSDSPLTAEIFSKLLALRAKECSFKHRINNPRDLLAKLKISERNNDIEEYLNAKNVLAKPYSCEICGQRFSLACSKKKHQITVHRSLKTEQDTYSDFDEYENDWRGAPSPTDSNADGSGDVDTFNPTCSECGLSFPTLNEMMRHRSEDHGRFDRRFSNDQGINISRPHTPSSIISTPGTSTTCRSGSSTPLPNTSSSTSSVNNNNNSTAVILANALSRLQQRTRSSSVETQTSSGDCSGTSSSTRGGRTGNKNRTRSLSNQTSIQDNQQQNQDNNEFNKTNNEIIKIKTKRTINKKIKSPNRQQRSNNNTRLRGSRNTTRNSCANRGGLRKVTIPNRGVENTVKAEQALRQLTLEKATNAIQNIKKVKNNDSSIQKQETTNNMTSHNDNNQLPKTPTKS